MGTDKRIGFTSIYLQSTLFISTVKLLIDHCRNYKTKVIPWTVNDKKEMKGLKRMGVDGIITDYPNLFNE